MTWVFLTNDERKRIKPEAGPNAVSVFALHEAAVRDKNPRDEWVALSVRERVEIIKRMPRPFYSRHLFAVIEAKLKEKNT